jgi:hypothetical protein
MPVSHERFLQTPVLADKVRKNRSYNKKTTELPDIVERRLVSRAGSTTGESTIIFQNRCIRLASSFS